MLLAVLLACGAAAGQTGEVRGSVADARGGEVLARVRVLLTGTEFAAETDGRGRFRMAGVPPGEYVLHVSTVGYRLLKRPFPLAAREIKEFDVVLSPETLQQTETVEVRAGPFDTVRQDSPSQLVLAGTEAKNLGSVLADDPLRAVQSLPGVASNDDFNARFSMRGADYHRIGVYLDDILLHTPFHMVQGDFASGSLTAFNGDMLEEMDLHAGAYPARFEDRTAAALDAHTREGNRQQMSARASASFSNAGVIGEGPLGKRGSWVAGARKSYLQYIIGRTSTDPSIAFGFEDTQGRLSYELAQKHYVTLAYIEGFSSLDRSGAKSKLGNNSVMGAGYHITLANLGWRYTPVEKLVITSRAAYMRERFDDRNPQELTLGAGYYGEWVGRTEMAWAWNERAPLEAGCSARRLREDGFTNQYQFNPFAVRQLNEFRGSAVHTGCWAGQGWSAWQGRLHFAAGGRRDSHSVDGVAAFSPQASVGVALGSTRIQFGWGQYVQFPELDQLLSRFGSRGLLPERANHAVIAVEQRLGGRTRVRVEAYQRDDRDLLFRPFYEPRLIAGKIFNPPANPPWQNSVRGYARGIEVFVQRRSANRLTGWASYALGYARLRDGAAQIGFPADEDQRHTVNVFGSYRIRPTVNVSLKWLYGSGFPLPGFYQRSNGAYYLAEGRNLLRLDPYQRTDARINKAWAYDRWKLTLYGEVVNLSNRRNYRFDTFNGYNPRTGQASLTLDRMFPILPSIGLLLEK